MMGGDIDIFSRILGNIKGSKDNPNNAKLLEKISKMDLSEMRIYVNGKLTEYKVDEFGLSEILKKLTFKNENTSHYYMNIEDMDSKKKKIFDLIILILSHKTVSINIIEIVQKFLETYDEIIQKYDNENKQTYKSKIKTAMKKATDMIDYKSDIVDKMRTLK
ncbi:hypothetical protein FJR48_11870 [Sulfurimonas lithotrophica]|uniref:Uncharacterized protein n=1 Tax=Sulfurimonas lithotrophica TaxID=2590022 RepID=A0A5P8P3Z2_9BACT|nr:hypothetical protein [Sulfurimonas lithotrophica]QFR50386.1 hypothetical protein FJR48_11870 [Sulfurimonas lithotrophica]